MGNNNPNISYTINIDTYVRDITKDIKKQKRELVDFKSAVDNMNLGDEISKQIQQVIDELDKMQEKYVTNLKKFADSKLSTESFDKFTKKFNDDMSLISERMTKIESKVYDLSEKFSSVKGVDKLQDKFDKLQNKVDLLDGRIKNLMRDMKDTIKILKDFDSMTTMNNTSKGLKDINKTISKLNKVNVDKKGSSIFENDINKLKDSFVDTYERMTDLQDQLGKEKEPKAIRRLQDELVDTIELLEQTGKAIAEMTDGKSMLKTSASFTRKGFEYHVKDIAEEIVDLQDAESIIAKSLAKSKAGIIEIIEALNKEVTTSAESFKFKKGGIVIPVILDPNSKQFLEDETQKLVKVLNDYAELHPVNVTFRLFPMTGSKADVSSISKSMKEVRAEIEKIEEPELKARFSEFSDKLEKQYQQALKLRIAVEISQTADEVKRDIEKIKDVVKNAGIGSIDLTFDISDEEAEKIKLVYNKKVVGKIQSMANSLSKIFDVKTISDWSTQFRTALGQISDKLKIMQPLIQPLADLTLSQDIKKKRGRPKKDTLENKNIIDGFTKTMDLLNKSLAERSKAPKLNAEEFTQEIQEAIDKADIPVTVPVEPDTQGFIEQLEDRLKSVPVNVVVGNVIGGAVSGGAGAGIVVTGGNVTMENPTVDESGVKETKSKGGEKSTKQKQDSSSIFGVSKDFIKKEFANVSFDGKNKGVKKTDEEKKLTDAFYELYDSYKELMASLPKITSGIEKAKERSEKLEREVSLDPLNKEKIKKSEEYNAALPEKLAERMKLLEENRAKIELIEKEFPSFKDSNFNSRRTRENLLKEFLKSKGIERTASLTPKQYLDNLKDEVTSKGSLSGTGAKKLINSIVDRFIGFEQLDLEAQMKKNDGHSVTELTKNATDEFNKLFTEYSHLANDAGKIGKEIETLRENKGYAYKKKIAEKQTELDAQNVKIDEFVKNNKVFSNVIPNKPLDEQKNKLLKKYINSKNIYKTRGMSITDLTDDSKAKNKLLKAYNKRLGIVDDNKKANEEYADSSEKIARKSMFEGVATEELQKKYTELAKEKEKLSEYTSSDLLTDSTKDKEGIQSIIKSIDWLKKSNKIALDYKKKGLINGEGLSLDEAKKRGFTIQGDEIIDALTQEDISKDIIKGLVEKYGISEDMLKGINRKSKAKVEDLAKEILTHGKRNEMGKNIDNEMRQITTELSLREKEEEARKKAEEEAQKKNKKKKTESKETKIEATSADEASTDSINKESEALENNTNEQEKNNKVKKEKIDIAQQIRDRIAREREKGEIDTTGIPEDTLETALATTIKTAEEKGTGVQSALGVYKYLINFYKESKKAMLEGLQSGQDVGTTQDVKDTQKKINAEKKETVNYDSMSEEELQKCLATEEKILARCKEGSEAYNRRKQTIEEINTLLSSKKGQTDTTPESDLESKENTFQGLIDRIKKYDEEKVKISELKKIYKEYLDLVDTLPYDGEQGTHVWGINDDDRDITEFLAKQLSKNGYKYSEKYDDFVKGNSKFGFDSDTADNISEIINRESDAIEREANAVKKDNEAIKENKKLKKEASSTSSDGSLIDFSKYKKKTQDATTYVGGSLNQQKEQFEDLGESATRVLSEIGMSYDDYIKKINSQKRGMNWGERLATVSDGIITESIKGSQMNVGWSDDVIIDKTIDKIIHLHPNGKGQSEVFSPEDIIGYVDKVLSNGYKIPFELWQNGQKTTLDFTNIPRQLIEEVMGKLINVNEVVQQNLKKNGGSISSEYSDEYQQLTNSMFKAIIESYGGTFETDKDYNSKINPKLVENNLKILDKYYKYMSEGIEDGKIRTSEDAGAFLFLRNLFNQVKNSIDLVEDEISPELEKFKNSYNAIKKEIEEILSSDFSYDDAKRADSLALDLDTLVASNAGILGSEYSKYRDDLYDNIQERTLGALKSSYEKEEAEKKADPYKPKFFDVKDKFKEDISFIDDYKKALYDVVVAQDKFYESTKELSKEQQKEKWDELTNSDLYKNALGLINQVEEKYPVLKVIKDEIMQPYSEEEYISSIKIMLDGISKIKKEYTDLQTILKNNNVDLNPENWNDSDLNVLPNNRRYIELGSIIERFDKMEEKSKLRREKKEVTELIDELYRLNEAQEKIDDIASDEWFDNFNKQAEVGNKLTKYFDYPLNPTDQINPDYYAEQYGEKYGEKYVKGVESQVDEAKQAGADLGNAVNEGAADETETHSPSKVAERLGEYWGIGYAQGIKKHKNDVEDAVRELVNAGKLTIEDLQKDLDTLLSGGFGNKYKALKNPLTNILAQKSKSDSKKKVQVDRYLNKDNATKDFKAAYDKYFSLREKTDDKSVNSKNKLLERFPTLKDIGNKKADEVNYDAELNKFLKTQTKLKEKNSKATDKQADSVKKESKNIEENTKKKKENKKVIEDTSKKEVQVDRYRNKDNATKAFEDAYNKYFDLRDKTDDKSVNSKNKLLERFPTLKDIGNKNKDEVKYADELNKFLQTQTKLKEANAKATDKQADAVKAETEEVRKNTEEKKKNNAEEKKNDSSVADTSSQIKASSGEFDKEKSGVTRTIKGVITRLNNSDELSKEQLDKADSTFAKWINKAKELGMDVSKFEQDFSSARAKFGESVEDSLGKIEEETRVEIKSLDDKRKEYLNLLKDVGKKYLGEEDVDMVQQTRIKETKEGQFKAISYKVSGKSGSVTLDPNGQVIATRKPVSDDYSRRQETVNTLVKEQDVLLKDILKKEKQIGIARADGFDSLAETLSKQVEEKQKLYDENKQSLKEMGEEEVLQQQLIKEVADRKKQEEEINEIISRRNDKARKAEEVKAQKDKQKLDKQVKDYVDKIEKQSLSLDDQALAQITNANVGVSKPEGYYDYKKYTEGDKWVGALTGADDLINKYKELLQAEKKLDEVTKNYEKAPETYAQAWQDAKDNVSALTGEVRDLAKVISLDSLSSDQMTKWTEIDEAIEEVRRKRDAKVEEKTNKEQEDLKKKQQKEQEELQKKQQKETAEAEKQKSKEVNKLLNDRLTTYREIYNIADQIRKLDGVEDFDQISELIKQQKEKHLSIYDTNEKIRKLDPNAVLDSENIEKMKKIRKDYHDKLYVGHGKESDDARRMRSIKDYSELNEKVKEYIKLKKDIANGKGLEGDVERAETLYENIQNVTKALSNSNLFNEKLEAKATKGLSTIDKEVYRIQKQNAKKNYEKKQKDDELEKQKKINNLLDAREKAYKKIWDYAVEIAKLDPDKNAKEIQDVNYKQNVQQQIFDNITRKLSVGDITDAHKEKLRQISTDAYDKMDKNIARAEDDNLIKKSAKAYSSLGDMVREYISLKKEIARGKGLAGDDAEAKQLKKDIDDLNNLLIGSSLYNGDFEEKAMKGFSTIDTEVARIEAKLQDASQKKLYQKFTDQKGRLESAKYDLQFEIDNGNHTDAFVQDLKQKILDIDAVINDINTKPIDVVTQADINNASDLLERVRQIRKEGNLTANKKANENSLKKNLTQVNSILSENTKMSFRNSSLYREFSELQNIFKTFDTSRPQEELARLTTRMLKAKAEFEELDDSFKGKGFFGLFAERLRGINAQFLAQYFSWQDFIRYGRTAISTIIDLDTQLVDLRKTTKMNNEELEEFYYNANQVAKRMGVTTSEIISQAAAWSRLGFNTKEASTQMAEISSKFASISPGMTTENATDYLVSTIQAYGVEVEDVERTILDNVNAVGKFIAQTYGNIRNYY